MINLEYLQWKIILKKKINMNKLSLIGLIILLIVIVYELSVLGYISNTISNSINGFVLYIQNIILNLNGYLKG